MEEQITLHITNVSYNFLPDLDSCLNVIFAGADMVLLYCHLPNEALKVFIIFLDPEESDDWVKASLAFEIFAVKISLPFSELRKSLKYAKSPFFSRLT